MVTLRPAGSVLQVAIARVAGAAAGTWGCRGPIRPGQGECALPLRRGCSVPIAVVSLSPWFR
eukprot:1429953-Prorocentrum_lima.AAC.1